MGRVVSGNQVREYYLNRKQAIFITAKSDTPDATAITIEIIERFDAYERGAQPAAFQVPQPYSGALRLAADLQEQNEAQSAQLAAQAPDVAAMALLRALEGSMLPFDAAKTLKQDPQAFVARLIEAAWLFRRERTKGAVWRDAPGMRCCSSSAC